MCGPAVLGRKWVCNRKVCIFFPVAFWQVEMGDSGLLYVRSNKINEDGFHHKNQRFAEIFISVVPFK